jgi:hypothetical protein
VYPVSIAVEVSGDLAVIDAFLQAVVRVDPVTGDRTILSEGPSPGFLSHESLAV